MTVEFAYGDFHAVVTLENIPLLPLHKIRKLFQLLLTEHFSGNSEAVETVELWLPQAIEKARNEWRQTSKNYADCCHTTDSHGYPPSKKQQARLDRPLISAMKKAKSDFERIQKIRLIFQEIKNKE